MKKKTFLILILTFLVLLVRISLWQWLVERQPIRFEGIVLDIVVPDDYRVIPAGGRD